MKIKFILPPAFFLFIMCFGAYFTHLHDDYHSIEHRQTALILAANTAYSIEKELTSSLSVTNTLEVMLHNYEGFQDKFSNIAETLIRTYKGMDAIGIAPDGVVSRVYPLAGNENAIGHDLLNDPKRREECLLAIRTGKLTLSGPFELVQGGEGVIGRLPVFITDTLGVRKFWGFTFAVIKMQAFLENVEVQRLDEAGFFYQLWRINPATGLSQVISANIGSQKFTNPVNFPFEVPNGTWTLSVLPKQERHYPLYTLRFYALFFIIAFCMSAFLFLILQHLEFRRKHEAEIIENNRKFELLNSELMREIEERKHIESELRSSEEKFSKFFLSSPNIMIVTDPATGEILEANDVFYRTFGFKYEEVVGRTYLDLAIWPDIDQRRKLSREIKANGEIIGFDIDMFKNDGTSIKAVLTAKLLSLDDCERLLCIITDMTERRRLEESLRLSEERYRTLFENASDAILIVDENGRFTAVNQKAVERLGYSESELLCLGPVDIEDEAHVKLLPQRAQRLMEEGNIIFESVHVSKTCDRIPVEVNARLVRIHDRNMHVCIVRDISERKKAEEELHRSRQMLQMILDNIPQRVFWKDKKLSYLGCNRLFAIDAGLSDPDEIIGKTDFDFSWKDYAQDYQADDLKVLSNGIPRVNYEEPIKRLDGSIGWARTSKIPLYDIEGSIFGILGTFEEISAYKEAEEKNQCLASIVESSEDAIIGKSLYGVITSWNKGAEKIFGYKEEEIIGKSMIVIFPDELVEEEAGILETINYGGSIEHLETLRKHKDGHYISVSISVSPIRNKAGDITGASSIVRDISDRKLAEEKLQQLNERFDLAAKSAGIGVWDWDVRQNRLYWDERMFRLYGIKGNAFKGAYESWLKGVHPEDKLRGDEEIRQALEDKKEFDTEFRVVWPDGQIKYLKAFGRILRDEKGLPLRMTGVNYDITARKLAEERLIQDQKRLESLIRVSQFRTQDVKELLDFALEEAICLTGSKIGYIYHYDSTKQEFILDSYSKNVMKECSVVFPKTCYALEKTGFWGEAVRQKKAILLNDFTADNPLKRGYPDGHAPLFRYLTIPVFDKDEIVGVVAVANKDTDYDQSDVLQLTLLMDSTWKVADRIRSEKELFEAKEAAEAATRAKSEFLANMSHEIRTPMNAVLGLGHLIMQTELSPKQWDYMTKINSSAQSLLGILNDILDFSKIEAGKLEIERMDFSLLESLNRISNLITVRSDQKGLEVLYKIEPDLPNNLVGDSLRLEQVLVNLLGNAVKFTEKGQIVLTISKDEDRTSNDMVVLRFSVKDTGVGISAEQSERLFQPFTQTDSSTTRRFGGTGLGLSICKRLVELMGGAITVESQPGNGSVFTFTASFGRSVKDFSTIQSLPTDIAGMRVLVIDDNPVSLEVLQEMLERQSLRVTKVSSGKEALDELIKSTSGLNPDPYNLVLIDWRMPEMDGLETAKRINELESLPFVPLIIITSAFGGEEIRQKAAELGVNTFLSKPIMPHVLYRGIWEALGNIEPRISHFTSSGVTEIERIRSLNGSRVLLVEDHPINQQIAREILENVGIQVDIAENGKKAVELVKREGRNFSAVLMDLQMPVMDGYEATARIRELYSSDDLPIIAMTAHAMADEKEKCFKFGMNDHIAKPIDVEELYRYLLKWICPVISDSKAEIRKAPEPIRKYDLPKDLPGFNVEACLKRIGGNRDLFMNLVISFRNQNLSTLEIIKKSIDSGQLENLIPVIHTLKSLAGNLCIENLYSSVEKMETAIRNNDSGLAKSMFETLKYEMDKAFEAAALIEAQEERSPIEIRSDVNTGDLEALFADLRDMLNTSDLRAEDVLRKISLMIPPSPELAALKDDIEKLDFRNALNDLDKLVFKIECASD